MFKVGDKVKIVGKNRSIGDHFFKIGEYVEIEAQSTKYSPSLTFFVKGFDHGFSAYVEEECLELVNKSTDGESETQQKYDEVIIEKAKHGGFMVRDNHYNYLLATKDLEELVQFLKDNVDV